MRRPGRSVALRRFRAGLPVRLIDKIADLGSQAEIDGFEGQLRRDGVVLNEEERAALWERRAALRDEKSRRASGR